MSKSQHRLRIGDLVVSTGAGPILHPDGYSFVVYGEGFDRGKPEPITVTIQSQLQDGGRAYVESYGLREVSFFVVVRANDSIARAKAEEALAARCGIRTEIGWISPDGLSAESVWDVETSEVPELVYDDLMEVQQGELVFAMRFTCQPFARPNAMDLVEALPIESGVTPETLTIDAGTATTRWTARIGALSDAGSFLRISGSKSPRAVWTGAAPFDTSGHHYIALDYTYPYLENKSGVKVPYLIADGVRCDLAALTSAPSGFSRATFWVAANAVAKMEFGLDLDLTSQFDFTNLTATNVPPFNGSTRQTSRFIDVKGSARAQGRLAVAAPEGGTLGTVLVYTSTQNVVGAPSMRRNRVSGGVPVSTPAGLVSGAREVMSSGIVFEVPVAELARGLHALVGRFYVVTAGTFTVTWEAQTIIGGVPVGAVDAGSGDVTGGTGEFVTATIGNVHLPPGALPDESSALVRITLTCDDNDLTYDESWHFNRAPGVGELTHVEVGGFRRLWIDSPTTERPQKAIFIGNDAERLDAFHVGDVVEAWGDHEYFKTTFAFVVTSDTDAAGTEFAYHRRYVNTVLEDGMNFEPL